MPIEEQLAGPLKMFLYVFNIFLELGWSGRRKGRKKAEAGRTDTEIADLGKTNVAKQKLWTNKLGKLKATDTQKFSENRKENKV